MALSQNFLCVILTVALVQAEIVKDHQENVRNSQSDEFPQELSGQFEGDMVLSEQQQRSLWSNKRTTLIGPSQRWPGGIVPVSIFEPHFTSAQVEQIDKAMQHIQSHSCVKFVKRTVERSFVNITGDERGCYSSLGYHDIGQQILNVHPSPVGTGCFKLGEVAHLLLHILGFVHQHSAFDRDEYVDIVWDNIDPTKVTNFDRFSNNLVQDFGVPYDYDSVMHFDETAFSKNGKQTIVPKDPNARIGQREGLSDGDILKLNFLYECANKK